MRPDPPTDLPELERRGMNAWSAEDRAICEKDWLLVSTAALAGKPVLAAWVRRGGSFARPLPPK